MAVHLIIDGYNLIRHSPTLAAREKEGLEEGRNALLARLKAYKRIKAVPITVVFDAAGGPHLAEKTENVGGVKIVYSPAGQTADQVIIRLARSQGGRAVVVTSDRDLAEKVGRHGATTVTAPEFEGRLEMAIYSEVKGAGAEAEDQEPTLSTRKKGPSRRQPKAARLRETRLKKI